VPRLVWQRTASAGLGCKPASEQRSAIQAALTLYLAAEDALGHEPYVAALQVPSYPQQTTAVMVGLAARYASSPALLGLELMNEPTVRLCCLCHVSGSCASSGHALCRLPVELRHDPDAPDHCRAHVRHRLAL